MRPIRMCFAVWLVITPVGVSAAPHTADDAHQLGELRSRVLYGKEAAQRIRAQLVVMRADPRLPAEVVARYETYLARIETRLRQDLQLLQALQPPAAAGAGAPASRAVPTFRVLPVETEGEALRRGELELDRSLGNFDEMLLREVEVASERSAERASRAAGSHGGAAGEGSMAGGEGAGGEAGAGGEEGASGEEGAAGEQGLASGAAAGAAGSTGTAAGAGGRAAGRRDGSAGDAARRGETRSGGGTARPGQGGSPGAGGGMPNRGRGVPPDIPDGSDDDVVARQIREAAEAETDPELRDRLWQEYRDYKSGRR